MTNREKMLGGLVGGVLVLFGGYKLVETQVIQRDQRMKQQIAQAKETRDKLETRLQGADRTIEAWQKRTQHTLGTDYFANHQEFREDVSRLLDRNNLSDGLVVNKLKEREVKKGANEGFIELPLSIRVNGKLRNLVDFLRDLYQRPYYVRVDKLNINAKLRTKAQRERDKQRGLDQAFRREGPDLSLSLQVSTLILPKLDLVVDELTREVAHPTLATALAENPEMVDALAGPIELGAEPEEYARIVAVHPFKLYEPEPPPVVVKRDPPKREEPPKVVENTPKEPPPPPPPPPRPKKIVTGVGVLPPGRPVVYLLDEENFEPAETKFLNDEVDDGKLVLIDPRGIVVRSPKPQTAAARGARRGRSRATPTEFVNYFYPIGSKFAERVELDPVVHPEVAARLKLARKDS